MYVKRPCEARDEGCTDMDMGREKEKEVGHVMCEHLQFAVYHRMKSSEVRLLMLRYTKCDLQCFVFNI